MKEKKVRIGRMNLNLFDEAPAHQIKRHREGCDDEKGKIGDPVDNGCVEPADCKCAAKVDQMG